MSLDIKNDKQLFIFRRLSIIAQKLYELNKYNKKFSSYSTQGSCGRFNDMSALEDLYIVRKCLVKRIGEGVSKGHACKMLKKKLESVNKAIAKKGRR